jgi:hypothetical protein
MRDILEHPFAIWRQGHEHAPLVLGIGPAGEQITLDQPIDE